jgi:heme-degrading monooxygenase HmoA
MTESTITTRRGPGPGPGFVVLYRWRLQPGREEQFIAAWSRITDLLRRERGSLGSRLHRGSDGLWYGYAQWSSDAARQAAFAIPVDPEASAQLRDAVEVAYPEVALEAAADFLVLPEAR